MASRAIVNTAQVLWLEARDPRTTRIHFGGSNPRSVKGSVADVARQLSPGL